MRYTQAFVLIGLLAPPSAGLALDLTIPATQNSLSCSNSVENLTEDQVQLKISDAERIFKEGEKFLKMGDLEKAQENFEAAAEMIQKCGYDLEKNPRLQEYFNALLRRIEQHEIVFLDKDEPVAQTYEPALIDEVGSINLFPIKIDPRLKGLVDEDLAKTIYDIPVTVNDRVLKFLEYFQTGGRERFEKGLIRSGRYKEMIRKIFAEEQLPNDMICMAMVESLFNPLAYSRARAKGIWQFISSTAKGYGLHRNRWLDERSDPEKSTRAAARHIKDLREIFDDWHLVMAAYNAGKGKILRAIQRAGTKNFWELADRGYLPRETTNHVPAILASLIIFKNPGRYGFTTELDPPLRIDKVSISSSTSLRLISKLSNTPLGTIKELNPDFIGKNTPRNYPTYQIKLPPGKGKKLSAALSRFSPKQRTMLAEKEAPIKKSTPRGSGKKALLASRKQAKANPTAGKLSAGNHIPANGKVIHKVKRGDTLYKIATLYNTTVSSVRDWNKLTSEKLHPGDKITIFPGR